MTIGDGRAPAALVQGLDCSLIQSSASSELMNALFIVRLPLTTTTAPQ
jgi:hypothetical protein